MNVNTYLEDLAELAIVRDDEKNKIKTSIATIKERIQNYFGDQISEIIEFGSYKRGTIISRDFDNESDIDIMIMFKNKYNNPQTYLSKLKNFTNEKYPTSQCKQSSPAIILELNHIKFDLVPAIYDNEYKIVNRKYSLNDWQSTNPNELNDALKNNQILRRLIRIIKIWNVKAGYIYSSYNLEKSIIEYYKILNHCPISHYINNNLSNLFIKYLNNLLNNELIRKDLVKKIYKDLDAFNNLNYVTDEIIKLFENKTYNQVSNRHNAKIFLTRKNNSSLTF